MAASAAQGFDELGAEARQFVEQKADNDYWQASRDFEARFSRWLCSHPKALSGARTVVRRIVQLARASDEPIESVLRIWGASNHMNGDVTGSVDRDYHTILEVVDRGNARELMALLYQSIRGRFMHNELTRIAADLQNPKTAAATREKYGDLLDLDYVLSERTRIDEESAAHRAREYRGRRDDDPPGRIYTDNTFFRRSSLWAALSDDCSHDCPALKDWQKPTVDEIHTKLGQVPMSYREMWKVFGKPAAASEQRWKKMSDEQRRVAALEEYRDEVAMGWRPGGASRGVPADSKLGKWAKNIKMPLGAGMSGSIDMYLHAGRYLGLEQSDMEKLRLAGLATMVAVGDHSVFEVMHVAQAYGLPWLEDASNQGYERFHGMGPKAYRNIAPIRPAEVELAVGPYPDVYAGKAYKDVLAKHLVHEGDTVSLPTREKGADIREKYGLGNRFGRSRTYKAALEALEAHDAKGRVSTLKAAYDRTDTWLSRRAQRGHDVSATRGRTGAMNRARRALAFELELHDATHDVPAAFEAKLAARRDRLALQSLRLAAADLKLADGSGESAALRDNQAEVDRLLKSSAFGQLERTLGADNAHRTLAAVLEQRFGKKPLAGVRSHKSGMKGSFADFAVQADARRFRT